MNFWTIALIVVAVVVGVPLFLGVTTRLLMRYAPESACRAAIKKRLRQLGLQDKISEDVLQRATIQVASLHRANGEMIGTDVERDLNDELAANVERVMEIIVKHLNQLPMDEFDKRTEEYLFFGKE